MSNRQEKVIIRADGSESIGMGHIMRTSVIAEELRKYVDVEYICMSHCHQGIDFLKKKGYLVIETNKQELIEVVATRKANAVITDDYNIDSEYIEKIRTLVPLVGYIDDDNSKRFVADFILNQNFKAEELTYKVNKGCKLFLGSKFILLREEFRKKSPIKINTKVNNVFITVGGGDPHNWLGNILREIYKGKFIYHVIIGPGFPYEDEIKEEYRYYNNIIFYKGTEISRIMIKCDMAISTCGSTLYELGILGIPTLGVSIVDNQLFIAKKMGEEGCICYLGDMRQKNMNILESVEQLAGDKNKREKIQKRNLSNINGNGVVEVVKYILDKL